MKLHELSPAPGSKKVRTRVGRGLGSGLGKTSGRGHKGQNSRAGGGVRLGFEGGQMPIFRRLPKRGFNNSRFAPSYIEVNVSDLEVFENGSIVDAASLKATGVITLPKNNDGIKILGNGEFSRKLTVKANAFTASAKEKIEKAGGTAEEV